MRTNLPRVTFLIALAWGLALNRGGAAAEAGAESAASANQLPARIRDISYYGTIMEIRCDGGPLGEMVVQAPAWRNEQRYCVGQTVWLHWPDDAAVIVHRDVEPGRTKPG